MKINILDNFNYCILSNNINNELLTSFKGITIIDSNLANKDIVAKLEFFPNKQVVFKESFYNLNNKEILEVINLLKKQNINYINITSNVEEAMYADKIIVIEGNDILLDDTKEEVLKNEKVLKKAGFGLPFVVDLSLQLKYYDVLDKVYFDTDSLMEALWN